MIKKCSSFFSQEIKRLRQAKLQSLTKLWFYDETEFSLNSTTLHGWLPKENATDLPAKRGNILTLEEV